MIKMASNSSKGTNGPCLNGLGFQVQLSAHYEIRRILSALGLSLSETGPIFKLFGKFRNCLHSSTKYRCVERLIPITIYLYCNLHDKKISEQELLEISNITKREFSSFKLQLRNFVPRYYSWNSTQFTNQRAIILQKKSWFDLYIAWIYTWDR